VYIYIYYDIALKYTKKVQKRKEKQLTTNMCTNMQN